MMHGFQQIVTQAERRDNFVVHGLPPLGDAMGVLPLIWRKKLMDSISGNLGYVRNCAEGRGERQHGREALDTGSFRRPYPPMAMLAWREHRAGSRAWGGGGARLGYRPHRDDLQDVDQRLGEVPTQGQ